MDAVRHIVREPELAFDVVTCVTEPLVPQLEAFRDRLVAEGVRHWRLFSIFPAGRAKGDGTLRLTDAGFRTLLDFIRRTRREGRIDASYACEGFLGGYEAEVRDHFYQCAAGVSVASVRVDGSISGLHVDPCEFPSGQYLPRPLLGGVAVAFRTLPRPGVDAPRRVCRLRGFPLLPGRRNAFA